MRRISAHPSELRVILRRRKCHRLVGLLVLLCTKLSAFCEAVMAYQPDENAWWMKIFATLPGLKQSARSGLHICMRAFWWLVVVICCVIIVIIIVVGIRRTMGHPLVVTIETDALDIGAIPFPSVTVSPPGGWKVASLETVYENHYKMQFGETIFDKDHCEWNKYETDAVETIVNQVCSVNSTYSGVHGVREYSASYTHFGQYVVGGRHIIEDNPSVMATRAIPFMQKGMAVCSEMIVGCHLGGDIKDCGKLFHSHFSDVGSSCMFNGIPGSATRRSPTLQTTMSHTFDGPELEYWRNLNFDRDGVGLNKEGESIPWRQNMPGRKSGLSFIVKYKEGEYGCFHSEGTGFLLTLNSPKDEPELETFGVLLEFGKEITINIYPKILLADDEIEDLDMDQRHCAISTDKEAKLDFYNHYTQKNCISECFAKKIEAECHCGKVTSPGNPNRTICNYDDMACVRNKEKLMYQKGLKSECPKCLPDCRDVKYRMSITSAPISKKLHEEYEATEGMDVKNTSAFSVVHVHFGPDAERPNRRGLRYSFFEQLGLSGGTTSMITGLSLLDIVELFVVIVTLIGNSQRIHNLATWVADMICGPATRSEPTDTELPNQENLPFMTAPHLEPLIIQVQPINPPPPIDNHYEMVDVRGYVI